MAPFLSIFPNGLLFSEGKFDFYPSEYSLTPLPNLNNLDADELYDMDTGPSAPIDPNRVGEVWFKTPKNKAERER